MLVALPEDFGFDSQPPVTLAPVNLDHLLLVSKGVHTHTQTHLKNNNSRKRNTMKFAGNRWI